MKARTCLAAFIFLAFSPAEGSAQTENAFEELYTPLIDRSACRPGSVDLAGLGNRVPISFSPSNWEYAERQALIPPGARSSAAITNEAFKEKLDQSVTRRFLRNEYPLTGAEYLDFYETHDGDKAGEGEPVHGRLTGLYGFYPDLFRSRIHDAWRGVISGDYERSRQRVEEIKTETVSVSAGDYGDQTPTDGPDMRQLTAGLAYLNVGLLEEALLERDAQASNPEESFREAVEMIDPDCAPRLNGLATLAWLDHRSRGETDPGQIEQIRLRASLALGQLPYHEVPFHYCKGADRYLAILGRSVPAERPSDDARSPYELLAAPILRACPRPARAD